uniref:Uncharacterized protein n=1 Tax=Aegilops tauschii subsp. strangulata TaxID=200361 RepID=A0A453IUZ4_AEGTS
MTRHVSMISISLSPKELDTNSPGYIKLHCMQSHLNLGTSKFSDINNSTSQDKIKFKQIHMYVEEAEGEEGAWVVGEGMVEVMVGMIITKEVMVDIATREDTATTKVGMAIMEDTATTKVGMATREVMATREGTAKTKVAMEGVMVMTKVDMGDMIMVAGITTRTEAVVAVGEEEATGDTVVQDTSAVDEVQVAQAAGATCGAVVGWVLAAGGATRTIRSHSAVLLQKKREKKVRVL